MHDIYESKKVKCSLFLLHFLKIIAASLKELAFFPERKSNSILPAVF